MDTKRIIKNVLFILLVPSVAVGAFYGYKYIKKKMDEKKAKENNGN